MLYTTFEAYKDHKGNDIYTKHAEQQSAILQNLNPAFTMRQYQKEAIGRLCYYYEEFRQKKTPIHLMFNMATGSGKTLIMAATLLYLYQKGYRNVIFFTRLGNIIEKSKANFLDPHSKKYLFAEKIVIHGQHIRINEVDNFEGANNNDINIIFSTTAGLHTRLNDTKENSFTYEDVAEHKIVLLADEAHNLSAETSKTKHNKSEEKDRHSWEHTVMRILSANAQQKNILLEFTATARLEEDYPDIVEKYKDKAIYRYDLKQYRQEGFSKDVRTLQIDAPLMERVLSAILISQYRRKIAEKHGIALKPVILFKANRVAIPKDTTVLTKDNPQVVVSKLFKEDFHVFINHLDVRALQKQQTIKNNTLRGAFAFFTTRNISLEHIVQEIQADFAPEKCLTVDEDSDVKQKHILLNSLEDQHNEIRAIFATEKLNEGWDVLNLFDIVRLYNSRDARNNKPGRATVQEAQLIGRGARYYPFKMADFNNPYLRKFDTEPDNELRMLEQLHYHSMTNSNYISELTQALVDSGIVPPKLAQYTIRIKPKFKETSLWKEGYIFLNTQIKNSRENILGITDAHAEFDHTAETNIYSLPTRVAIEQDVFGADDSSGSTVRTTVKDIHPIDFGIHIMRAALDRIPLGRYTRLKYIFGTLASINDFICDTNCLAGIKVRVRGTRLQLKNLSQAEKLRITTFCIDRVLETANTEKKEFCGTKKFTAHLIKEVFKQDKMVQKRESAGQQNLRNREWCAQEEIWSTSEEEAFVHFMDDVIDQLKERYEDIALIRNEHFFKIYNFSDGNGFAPDFVLLLKEKEHKKSVIYQVFIEPKGDLFPDAHQEFAQSKEGWKQDFLLKLGTEGKLDLQLKNHDFRLIGLPFFNEGKSSPKLRQSFEEHFQKQLLF